MAEIAKHLQLAYYVAVQRLCNCSCVRAYNDLTAGSRFTACLKEPCRQLGIRYRQAGMRLLESRVLETS